MKQFKKILCCLMALCMLLCTLPVAVYAAEDTESSGSDTSVGTTDPADTTEPSETTAPTEPPVFEEGTCGQEAEWAFDGSDNTLTISGTGMTYDYSSDSPAPWSEYKEDIVSVVVEDGISKIGSYAFYGCSALLHVQLPDSVLSIGNYAFASCKALAEIKLPKELGRISIRMFENCTALQTVAISEGVTAIETGAFIDCTSLTEIEIPDNVTVIGSNAFSGCTALETVTLSGKITAIANNTFYGCSALTDIEIPEGVTTVEARAFYSCTALTTVSLPKTLTSIGDSAFYNCTHLNGIQLPEALTEIGSSAFAACTKLEGLAFPKTLASIGETAFSGCTGLAQLAFAGDAPEIAENAFTKVTATAYYPFGNETWTEEVLANYGGTITWQACCEGEHEPSLYNTKDATCEEKGYTGDYICDVCGIVTEKGEDIPALGHDVTSMQPMHNAGTMTHTYDCGRCEEGKIEDCTYGEGEVIQEATMSQPGLIQYTCTKCGGIRTVEFTLTTAIARIYGDNRYETCFAIADAMKENLGVSKFDTVIVASGLGFADALSGSYLAAIKNAPILITDGKDTADLKEYINANLKSGGTVYILGGTTALPEALKEGLESFTVERLWGATRFETNLAILKEAGVEGKDILVCSALDFADSLSASAANRPILLVDKTLTEEQKAFLRTLNGNPFYIIGGTTAVSEALETELKAYGTVERIGGADRFETSVLVAHTFVRGPEVAVLAYAWNFPDGLCGGPLAVSLGAPLVLTANGSESAATQYVQSYKITKGITLGGPGLISEKTVDNIFTPAEVEETE